MTPSMLEITRLTDACIVVQSKIGDLAVDANYIHHTIVTQESILRNTNDSTIVEACRQLIDEAEQALDRCREEQSEKLADLKDLERQIAEEESKPE
jgi:hypothetical protein